MRFRRFASQEVIDVREDSPFLEAGEDAPVANAQFDRDYQIGPPCKGMAGTEKAAERSGDAEAARL
ncbi:MAG: hypothetical protein JOY71_24750 [Acetobacteraceae bacterium]|nr:hypothetical protein [Acetobacteraceae bacterium]